MCSALENNTAFIGPLDLSKNSLTDLSGLYLASCMKNFRGLTALKLDKNNVKSKTAEFIGDVLIDDPTYPIEELSFKDTHLEENGLRRLIIAATKNHNIRKLKLGYITDFGMQLLTQELLNTNLKKLDFQESEESPISEKEKDAFIDKLEDSTLEKVGYEDEKVQYYFKTRKEAIKSHKQFKKRNLVLAQKSIVKKVIKKVDGKKKADKVAIKKYFRNTFGDLLNDAMYELTRKQEKFPDNDEYFTVEGCCTFIGEFLLDHLPEHEQDALKEEDNEKEEPKE